MATTEELLIKLRADNEDLKRKLNESSKNVNDFRKNIMDVGKALGIAFGATELISFARQSFLAFEQQEKANRRLMLSVRGNALAYKDLTDQATRFQRTAGISDDAIQQIQTLAAQSGKTTAEVKKITEATIQLASVTGQDLQAAYLQINQTLTGSAGRLGRLDVEFTKLTEDQLKNGEAVDLILTKYKGFAEESATATDKFTQNWDEFKERVGGWLSSVFLPQLEKMNAILNTDSDKYRLFGGKGVSVYDMIPKPEESAPMNEADLEYWTKIYDDLVSKDKERLELLKQQAEEYEKMMKLETQKRDSYPDLFLPTESQFMGGLMGNVKPQKMTGGKTTLTAQGYQQTSNANPLDALQSMNTGLLEYRRNTDDAAAAAAKLTEQILQQSSAMDSAAIAGQLFNEIASSGVTSAEDLGTAIYNAARQIIVAKLSETIASAIASSASLPFPINIITAGIAGAGIAAVFNSAVPKLADGGIAYGSSLVNVGEYAGAGNNPEVIAPLSKLKEMIYHGGGGTLVTKISANDLYIMMKRGEYLSGRNGRR